MTLLILGIDGAVREYVEEAINRGMMPNMERLMEEGCFGDMRSTTPPVTIPAWVSMFSGLEPDKLETYHMTEMDDYEIRSVSNDRWRGRMIWDRLEGEFGLNSVPGNSPLRPVKGYAIEGMPRDDEPDVYPETLRDELSEIDYRKWDGVTDAGTKREIFLENFERKRELFSSTPDDVDVRIEVYHLPDRLGHAADNLEQILETYSRVDDLLGGKMEEYDDIIVVSDHGFKHVDSCFYVNTWLENQGYLEVESGDGKEEAADTLKSLAAPLAGTFLRPLLAKINDWLSSSTDIDLSPGSKGVDKIDFENTEAFSYRGGGNSYADIVVHDSRFPKGIVEGREKVVESIVEKLEDVEEVDKVWKREEVYEDPEGMPDIVIRMQEDVSTGSALFPETFLDTDAFVHSDTGIVGAWGESFRQGEIEDANIVEVASTIARYLAQDLGTDTTFLDVFSDDFEPSKPSGSDVSDIEV